jgi:histone H3/H4
MSRIEKHPSDVGSFTIAPIKKMLKKVGAKRVSTKAAAEFGKMLEEKTVELCQEANRLAEYRGKRTVMKEDVKMAVKRLK